MGLDYLSDNLIELRGPVNKSTGLPVTEAINACESKLYDTALDCRVGKYETVLLADIAAAASSMTVPDNTAFFSGHTMLIEMDDGAFYSETAGSPSGDTAVALVSATIPVAASKGNKVIITVWDSTSTVISIDNFDGWESGMNMEITVDGGVLVERTVSLIKADAGYLTLSASVGTDTSAGNLVKRRLGVTTTDDIDTTTAFGTFPTTVATTVEGDETWGFRGVIPHDHPDIRPGMRVRGEIVLIDTTPSPTLNMTRKVVETVINE